MICSRSTRNNSPRRCSRNRNDPMPSSNQNLSRWILFVFFFVSGFCSLVYQVIWTRLAFASFGIITPVLSVVISVFMLGLSLGSWLGGRFVTGLGRKTMFSAATFYGAAEFVIGLSALRGAAIVLAGRAGSAHVGRRRLVPLFVSFGNRARAFHSPLVRVHGRDLSVDDGLHSRDGTMARRTASATCMWRMCSERCAALFLPRSFLSSCLAFATRCNIAAAGNFIIALCSMAAGSAKPARAAGDSAPQRTDRSSRKKPIESCRSDLRLRKIPEMQ